MGNLDSLRDWGHAKLCENAMVDVATRKPEDYVIATGEQYSVRQFIEWCCDYMEIC